MRHALDDACPNWAKSFFVRCVEIRHHHHVAVAYLRRYAPEVSTREITGAF